MKLYRKYLTEVTGGWLDQDITSDEEYSRAIDDIRDDLKGLARKSSGDRKRVLKDIQSTIKDLIKYRG